MQDDTEKEIEDFKIEEVDVEDKEDWVEVRSKLKELISLNQKQE